MSWPAALLALLVSHLVGDFLLQTEWQAVNKRSGLRDRRFTPALISHVAVYMVGFIPALVWIGTQTNAGRAVAVGAVVAVTHLVIDDGHLVRAWLRYVKRAPQPALALMIAVDQTFHVLFLLGAALLAAA